MRTGPFTAMLGALLLFASGARADASLDEAAALSDTASSKTATLRDRETAQLELARRLRKAHLPDVAIAIVAEITEDPRHARFEESLGLLLDLATDVPDPEVVLDRLAKFDDAALDAEDRKRDGAASYFAARGRYRSHRFAEAISRFEKVPQTSKYGAKSRYWAGVAHVALRDPRSALASFERAAEARVDTDEDARIHDFALLGLARTHYSTAFRADGTADPAKLATAIRYWDAVDVAGESWVDAQGEAAWAHFLNGNHSRALGLLQGTHSPESSLLRGEILLASCRYDDAATLGARFRHTYEPVIEELEALAASFADDGLEERAYPFLRDVRDGHAKVSAAAKPLVEQALSDRSILRLLSSVAGLDGELKITQQAEGAFARSRLKDDALDIELLARDVTIRNAGDLARKRLLTLAKDLRTRDADARHLLAAAIAGTRGDLDERSIPARVSARDANRNVVTSDDEHVAWPFTGEIWRDEAGTLRESLRSQCRAP